MKCERAIELMTGSVEESTGDERRLAGEHVADCEACRDACAAVHALRLASLAPVPAPPPGAFGRAIARATGPDLMARPAAGRFWLGMGAGAALAASVAVAVVSWLPPAEQNSGVRATPQLAMRLNEPRDLSISLTTVEAMAGAEIHIVLSGAVDLDGYAGQRELRWQTDLEAGTNQLTLPVVATGVEGGQVLVEVVHGDKRRTFLVDVEARA